MPPPEYLNHELRSFSSSTSRSVFWCVAFFYMSMSRTRHDQNSLTIPGCLILADGFDHAERRFRRHNSLKFEPGIGQELAILLFATFAAAGQEQHFEIEPLDESRIIAGSQDTLKKNNPGGGTRGAMDVTQNRGRLGVIPVVDDVFHDVSVAFGNSLEEIAVRGGAAILQTERSDCRMSARDHMLKIEEHTVSCRIFF